MESLGPHHKRPPSGARVGVSPWLSWGVLLGHVGRRGSAAFCCAAVACGLLLALAAAVVGVGVGTCCAIELSHIASTVNHAGKKPCSLWPLFGAGDGALAAAEAGSSASVDLSSDSFELEERDGAHFGWAARCC